MVISQKEYATLKKKRCVKDAGSDGAFCAAPSLGNMGKVRYYSAPSMEA